MAASGHPHGPQLSQTIIQCDIATLRCACNNELTDIHGHKDCSHHSLFCTPLHCYHNMAMPGKIFQEEMLVKRVGCSNKPSIKAAQAMGKNSQSILDAGGLVIQRSREELTGKTQKYATMDARQFVPSSSQEEGYFINNCAPKIPSLSSDCGIFVENIYPVSDFFHFSGPLRPCLQKIL